MTEARRYRSAERTGGEHAYLVRFDPTVWTALETVAAAQRTSVSVLVQRLCVDAIATYSSSPTPAASLTLAVNSYAAARDDLAARRDDVIARLSGDAPCTPAALPSAVARPAATSPTGAPPAGAASPGPGSGRSRRRPTGPTNP